MVLVSSGYLEEAASRSETAVLWDCENFSMASSTHSVSTAVREKKTPFQICCRCPVPIVVIHQCCLLLLPNCVRKEFIAIQLSVSTAVNWLATTLARAARCGAVVLCFWHRRWQGCCQKRQHPQLSYFGVSVLQAIARLGGVLMRQEVDARDPLWQPVRWHHPAPAPS